VIPERPLRTDRPTAADRPTGPDAPATAGRPAIDAASTAAEVENAPEVSAAAATSSLPVAHAPRPAPPRTRSAPSARALRAPGPVAAPTNGAVPAQDGAEADGTMVERGATAPQLRRFIKSRAYVPMHELRRRFAINGGDDDVTAVELERQRIYVGLPEREGRLLGELLRGGDIGYELSLDPISPIVVGVYPMRPVTRA
jgi:hypothetical protein